MAGLLLPDGGLLLPDGGLPLFQRDQAGFDDADSGVHVGGWRVQSSRAAPAGRPPAREPASPCAVRARLAAAAARAAATSAWMPCCSSTLRIRSCDTAAMAFPSPRPVADPGFRHCRNIRPACPAAQERKRRLLASRGPAMLCCGAAGGDVRAEAPKRTAYDRQDGRRLEPRPARRRPRRLRLTPPLRPTRGGRRHPEAGGPPTARPSSATATASSIPPLSAGCNTRPRCSSWNECDPLPQPADPFARGSARSRAASAGASGSRKRWRKRWRSRTTSATRRSAMRAKPRSTGRSPASEASTTMRRRCASSPGWKPATPPSTA